MKRLTRAEKAHALDMAAGVLAAWEDLGPPEEAAARDLTVEQIDYVARDVARMLRAKAAALRKVKP